MHAFKTVLALAAAAASPATAYIQSLAAPATATAGSTIPATLSSSIYIQNYVDFGIVWGLAAPQQVCATCVGTQVAYTELAGEGATVKVPDSGNFTVDVPVPEGLAAGKYQLVAAVPYLVGASGTTGVQYYNATVQIS